MLKVYCRNTCGFCEQHVQVSVTNEGFRFFCDDGEPIDISPCYVLLYFDFEKTSLLVYKTLLEAYAESQV